MDQPERDIESLVTWTQVIYALHAFSLLTGILGVATVIGAFLTGWPSIIAVILNYLKRGDARGTWLESHFRWQIRTFWFGLLWVLLCAAFCHRHVRAGPARGVDPDGGRDGLVHLPRRTRLDGAQRATTDVRVGRGRETTTGRRPGAPQRGTLAGAAAAIRQCVGPSDPGRRGPARSPAARGRSNPTV